LHNLVGRIDGPLKFRLIPQPAVAIFFSTRAGLQDAREKRDPYFWAIFTEPRQRGKLIREGWHAVMKIFILAVLMDLIYQYLFLVGCTRSRRCLSLLCWLLFRIL